MIKTNFKDYINPSLSEKEEKLGLESLVKKGILKKISLSNGNVEYILTGLGKLIKQYLNKEEQEIIKHSKTNFNIKN